ncbi:methanogenic corrinoid protein MtbC1 [Motilibacter rhizosphaerae]|uniref:Methanogenic corrinoid protein MtbC1 n=1 Tax=Motilibacter rhizosphaerae TaxID=598652 RepID=A0A4Q7NG91_9ACTN|nr:cobalamin-dependent protein [Motilibacter rhizosphaerae]RZS82957.1 methanogenic corrinoid protein MtbC1 [Motilibacter rhizosphaerae]
MTGEAERYLDLLGRPDRAAAVRLALDLVEQGVPAAEVLTGLVCRGQEQVGRLWQAASWDVAREHAATAVSDAVVSAVGLAAPPRTRTAGRVIVCCVEAEWHALPARIVAEVLELAGWDVTFLGASVPPAHLAQYLHDTGPDAVALSCSLASALPRARRMVEACREAGVPVLVGGRGFGPDDLRARRIGANAWAADAAGAVAVLQGWAPFASPPPPVASAWLDEHARLAEARPAVLEGALTALAGAPWTSAYGAEQWERTREDLGHLVDFLAATLYVDDERILADYLAWCREVLTARGVPYAALLAGLRAVRDALPVGLDHAAALLTAAIPLA